MPRDAELATRIARQHRLPGHPIAGATWPGAMNHVFIVGSGTERMVVRFARDQARTGDVESDRGAAAATIATEAWCAARARARGIPTAKTVARGSLEGVAYLLQRFVPGVNGEQVRSAELWQTLGRYASEISTIELDGAPDALFSRFGRDLPAAWQAHVAYNVDGLAPGDPLVELGVYATSDRSRLRDLVGSLALSTTDFGLSHGDLALRNLIVDGDAPPVLIDWESASTGPVPHTDLLNLLRNRDEQNNPRDDEIAAFADGYGTRLTDLVPALEAFRVLSALDLVRWAIDRRPNLVPDAASAARTALAAWRPR